MISQHALERAANRLMGLLDHSELERLCEVYSVGTVGVVVRKLDKEIRDPATGSNGDLVVAVIRKGTLSTIMLRRSSQKVTEKTLFVDLVVWDVKNE